MVSPQKRGQTNYPLGPFSIKRSKGCESGGAAATTVAERGSSDEEVESYSEYLEYIQSVAIGFLKLHGDMYVVQGWDGERRAAKV